MHLYFMTRGEKSCTEKFANDLAAQHFYWNGKNDKGKKVKYLVQGTLQPILAWSFVFPKENLDMVLNTLQPRAKSYGSGVHLPMAVMRKALGASKIPEWNSKAITFPLYKKHLQILGIGIREDAENKFGNEML